MPDPHINFSQMLEFFQYLVLSACHTFGIFCVHLKIVSSVSGSGAQNILSIYSTSSKMALL